MIKGIYSREIGRPCLKVKRAGEPSLIPYNIVSIEGEIPCLPSLRAASEEQVIVTSLSVVEL